MLPHWLPAEHLPLAIFLGCLLAGESVVLAGAFLAARGAIAAPTVFLMALLASMVSDAVWFLFGTRIVAFAARWQRVRGLYDRFMAVLTKEQTAVAAPERFLLVYKFIYGVRIVTILYTALRRLPLWRFLLLNGVGTAAYLAVLVSAGVALTRRAQSVAPAVHALRYALAAPVVLFVLVSWGTRWARKRLFEE
jgi:membrane protein DedA with SNARE-associated domain